MPPTPTSDAYPEGAARQRVLFAGLLGFVALVLLVLLLVPIRLDDDIDGNRTEFTNQVMSSRAWSAELGRQFALAAAAGRGFLISGDGEFVGDFGEAAAAADSVVDLLDAMAPTLGPDVPEAMRSVREAWAAWRGPAQRWVEGALSRPEAVQALPVSQAHYETLLAAAETLEATIDAAVAARLERIRTLERTQRMVSAVLVPLALLAAAALFWIGLRLHAQTEALGANEIELRTLTADLERRVERRTRQVRRLSVAAAEAERREQARIAQLLHDHLQQLLYGARMRLGLLPRTDDIHAVDGILTDAIQATRTLVAELAPPVLREDGLPAALDWLAVHTERVHRLRVEVDAEVDASAHGDIPNHVRDLVFQIARELLFNVVKHAGVDEARVTLRCDGRTLTLTVADEGDGFDPATTPDGYGLGSVKERIMLVEGTLRVDSRPSSGTTIRVIVPLDEASPNVERTGTDQKERGAYLLLRSEQATG